MWLFSGENFDEFVEISDTSASKKLEQLVFAVTWLYNVDNVFSLRPRDTSDRSKLSDKRNVSENMIQQLNTTDRQLAHQSFVQRSNVTAIISNICTEYQLGLSIITSSIEIAQVLWYLPSVCPSVSKISQKVIDGFELNYVER